MKYFEHKISPPNDFILKSIYWLDCDEINHYQFFLPDGHPELMITDLPISVVSGSKSIVEQETCLFWGQIRFSGYITCTQPYKMFGLKFQPWVLRLITDSDQATLIDRVVTGNLVFSTSILKYIENLLEDSDFQNSLHCIEEELSSLLMNNLSNEYLDQLGLIKVVETIKKYPDLKISELLPLYDKSLRTLETQFRKDVGISPKEYQRIVRLRKVSQEIKEGKKFIHAALDSGYYDQAHFSKEFRKVTQKKPSQFMWNTNLILSKI